MAFQPNPNNIDKSVPESVINRVFTDEHLRNRSSWSEDLVSLFTPSVEARPLHLPGTLKIKTRLNKDVEFYWARDREGSNPNHQRVGELRSMGFDFAIQDLDCKHENGCGCDVIMANDSVVKSKTEIRCGDLVMVKCAKSIWRGIRKYQQMQSIVQTNRHSNEDRAPMSTLNSLPGVKTQEISAGEVAEHQSHRSYDPESANKYAADDPRGIMDRLSSNTTRASKGGK